MAGKLGGGGGGAGSTILMFGYPAANKLLFLDDPLNPTTSMTFSFRILAAISQQQAGTDYSGSKELAFNVANRGGVTTITGSRAVETYGDAEVAAITIVPTIGDSGGRPVLHLTLTQGGVAGPTHADVLVEWVQAIMGNF